MCDRHKFNFEFDKAFNHQLIEKFEASPEHPLAEDVGPRTMGVYALYWNGAMVYAGKALKTTLRGRLRDHTRKIASRRNISVDEMTCRFLEIDGTWFVRAAEDALITHYMPQWNLSGFGGHVPGVGRPGTHRVPRFDQEFPVREDYQPRGGRRRQGPPGNE